MNIKNIFIIILLLIGVSLICYPIIGEAISSQQQHQEIENYNSFIQEEITDEQSEQIIEKAKEYNNALSGTKIDDPFIPGSGFTLPTNYKEMLNFSNKNKVMCILKIPKIDVELPVYHTTDNEVLDKGVGHMNQTSLPIGGNSTHSVLAAHRGLANSVLFRDIDQLKNGDIFYIKVANETHAYIITSIKEVLPSETSLLKPIENKDLITLVSCTPIGVNTYRILITGERTEIIPQEDKPILMTQNFMGVPLLHCIIGIISIISTIIIIIVLYRKEKQ